MPKRSRRASALYADRFKDARERAGLSQVELAVICGGGYTRTMISAVEGGRSDMILARLVQAVRALGVSLDYLVGLTDDRRPAAELSRLLLDLETQQHEINDDDRPTDHHRIPGGDGPG